MFPLRHLPLFLVASSAILLAPAIPASSSSSDSLDLPAEPPAKRSVALQEVWRLGADPDDVLVGLITSGVLDREGRVYLADRQLIHVLVVSADGRVLATVGRQGEAPGEVESLQSVFVTEGRVGMVQSYPGKVAYVDRTGEPAGGFYAGGKEAGGHYAIREMCSIGTDLVGYTDRSDEDLAGDAVTTHARLSVLDPDGTIETDLVTHDVIRGIRKIVLDEAAEWSELSTWAASRTGYVATVAERDAWSIHQWSLDGRLLRTLRRPYTARQRTAAEKEEATSSIRVAVATARSTFERKPLDIDPVIVDLQCARDGRLFVTTCYNATRLLEDGVAGRFDVIHPEGRFVEELTLTFDGFDPAQDKLIFLDGMHFLILRNYADAQKTIHAALLPKEEREDLEDAEPLEVVFVEIPQ